MSSPASVVTVELPRWPLADGLSLALLLAAGAVIEAVMARYPGAPAGAGVLASVALVAVLWYQRRRRPQALEFAPGANRLRFADGSAARFEPGPASRLLGASVVLHWQSAGRSGALWLTPADLPRERLRALAVRLATARRPVGP